MPKNARPVLSLLARALLVCFVAGCSSFSAIQPGDPADSITDRVGEPATVWRNEDGSELWQYPQGHYSAQTFVVSVGPDQRVKEVYQALSEAYFSRVQQGMSREDVQRLLGPPREVLDFPSRDEESWSWRYSDIGYMQFNVIFDRTHDRVKRVRRLQEVPPRAMRR